MNNKKRKEKKKKRKRKEKKKKRKRKEKKRKEKEKYNIHGYILYFFTNICRIDSIVLYILFILRTSECLCGAMDSVSDF